jgi:hypothetical protein
VKGRGREAAVVEGRVCNVMLIVQHSSCDVLRVGCNHLILAKYIQNNKMKFSLLGYETLSWKKHCIKYKQSIQSLMKEIYLNCNGMKFPFYLRLKNISYNPYQGL